MLIDREQDYDFESGPDTRSKQELQNELEAQSWQWTSLMQNVPGGLHSCRNDEQLTLLSVSDSFLALVGYSRRELVERFDGRMLRMIHPDDREAVTRAIQQQLQEGLNVELEFRLIRKSGTDVDLLDKGRLLEDGVGGWCFYCVLVDITVRKREREALRLTLERHQIIMDQTTDIIFEWDIPLDSFKYSQNWLKRFGYDPLGEMVSQRIPLSHNVHPDDMANLLELMQNMRVGMAYAEVELRIRNAAGRFLWCRVRATAQFNAYGRPIKAVGVILDIDAERRQRAVLLEQAQRDVLTGLYNKATVENLVKSRMSKHQKQGEQALLVIDVDHFKTVNDTYGHLCGDSVLSDVAAVLKGHLRATDIAGRVGGDEFVVYMPDVQDKQATFEQAGRLLEGLCHITPTKEAPPITCSIGIAVFPHGLTDYLNLYQCADEALYKQKSDGRDGVAFYDFASCGDQSASGVVARSVAAVAGSSDDSNLEDEQMAQYVFRVLYEADRLEQTLERLLEIIGRSYDVSRVYIFENTPDGDHGSITFEWCAAGFAPRGTAMRNFCYTGTWGDYRDCFDVNGVLYSQNAEYLPYGLYESLWLEGVQSILQCSILCEGRFFGGVGFEECVEGRQWSARQISSYKLTARVLGTFLIQVRLRQRLQAELQAT